MWSNRLSQSHTILISIFAALPKLAIHEGLLLSRWQNKHVRSFIRGSDVTYLTVLEVLLSDDILLPILSWGGQDISTNATNRAISGISFQTSSIKSCRIHSFGARSDRYCSLDVSVLIEAWSAISSGTEHTTPYRSRTDMLSHTIPTLAMLLRTILNYIPIL